MDPTKYLLSFTLEDWILIIGALQALGDRDGGEAFASIGQDAEKQLSAHFPKKSVDNQNQGI